MMKKVLLVDDNDALLFAFKKLSQFHDFTVETANSLEMALRMVASNRYDVLLTDLNLTGFATHDGYEIVKAAKIVNHDIRAYIWTAYDGDIEREESSKLGVKRFLAKPVSFDALLSIINEDAASNGSQA
jgi:CheY-like chemotaxis protein